MTVRTQNIHLCMERLGARYRNLTARREAFARSLHIDHRPAMPDKDANRIRSWFEDRMEYLQEQYRLEINAADTIIGKQWLYDQRVKLPPR